MNNFSDFLLFGAVALIGCSVYQGCRYTSRYEKISDADGRTRFNVIPSLPVGLFGIVGLAVMTVLPTFAGLPRAIATLFLIIPFLCVLFLFIGVAGHNKGRKFSSFTVDPRGIVTASGAVLDKADIARMYLTAPKVGEYVYVQGAGIGATSGVAKRLADRSWSFRIIANGQETILAGGLQEPTATSLMYEVGKIVA